MKNIVIIATGGTIAGSGDAGKAADYQAGRISVSDILESVPSIRSLAHLKTVQMCNIDSNDMDEERWIALRDLIDAYGADPDVDGIVVTHGTDTLEETAFFLTLRHDLPVVLTGSMRPATAASADGPMNLYQAVALACSEEARGAGVLAVFSDTIYSGRDIRKSNSYKTDAFEIGHFGSLGYMRDDQVCFLSRSRRPRTCSSPFSGMEITHLPRVSIAYWHCGADIGILDHMCEHSDGEAEIMAAPGRSICTSWLPAISSCAPAAYRRASSSIPRSSIRRATRSPPIHSLRTKPGSCSCLRC